MRTKMLQTPMFIVSLVIIHFSLTIARDTITLATPLVDGETLVSAGGSFVLGFFTPTNSHNRYVGLWFNQISVQTIVWVANRQQPVPDTTGTLKLTSDGNLIITNQNSTIFWSSATSSVTTPVAKLLDNGNLVVTEANTITNGSFAWQSFDHPTDSLLPGMKLGVDLRTGLNRNLTAWKSESDPAPGDYVLSVDIRGDPQMTAWAGTVRKWRSGPWNGEAFTGAPEMKSFHEFNFQFFNTKDEIYYSDQTTDKSIKTRLVMNHTGTTQRFVWVGGSDGWGLIWYTPKAQCDGFSLCGSYGVCSIDTSPMCHCFQGFKPRFPENWALRDGSGGCVRKTSLDCRDRTDGFMLLTNATLPDTSSVMMDMSMNLDECKASCLKNCSCTGYASADVRDGGSGCIMWVTELVDFGVISGWGQDLYIRLAAADLESISGDTKKKGRIVVPLTVSIVSGVLVIMASISMCIWTVKKRRRKGLRTSTDIVSQNNDNKNNSLELPFFHLDAVIRATNNFAEENILGEGGFGFVYKGKLEEGQEIAVKRLSKTSVQGIDEFKNELMLIAKLQHRNLVRLLGYSIHGEERMLIYEFMPHKSLDAFLFDKHKGVLLDWETRHNIILGVARGLLYLHQDSRFRIIHRDLKASNILLDKEMNPKISDFGMARISGEEGEASTRTRKVVGTYGYMSPEYAMDGIFSVKSDVYSFGVLVLEIISGQKNKGAYFADPHLYLLGMAWNLWNEGKSIDLIDPSMYFDSMCTVEIMRCINLGLLCVQEHPEDRPTMASVLFMLGNREAPLPKPRPPGFMAGSASPQIESSSKDEELHSANHATLTIIVGR